jgi:hypothetical protein
MGTIWISLGSSAGGTAGPSFALATLPEWIGVVIALLGVAAVFGVVAVLRTIHDRMPKESSHSRREFTRMLCDQVWTHTDSITNVFGERMRLQPVALEQLRVMVRLLREDLSAPVHFIDQMRGHPTPDWPGYDLFQAFSNWGGLVKAMESQLADLQNAVTYPLVKEPVDKSRDDRIVNHYITEQEILQRAIDKLRGRAFDLCAAAKAHLKKKPKPGEAEEDDGPHPDCPCCRKREGDHNAVRVESPIRLPPMPPAPPPAPPAPAPVPAPATRICVCTVPAICHCRSCSCSCSCVTVPAPAPAPARA